MEIKINVTEKDYADFNKYVFNKRRLNKFIVINLIISLILPFVFTHRDTPNLFDFIFFLLVYNLFVFVYMYIYLSRTKNIPMKDGMFLGDRKYIVQENEFICEKENGESTVKWDAIKSVETGSKAIYLFVDTNSAYIIPKRAFVDTQSQNEFIEKVQLHINNRANAYAD